MLKLFSMCVSFALSLILEQKYGDKIYGDFVISLTTIEILGIFSLIGFNQFFLVHIPKLTKQKNTISYIYTTARKNVLFSSIIISLFVFGASFLDLSIFEHNTLRHYIRYGSLCLPVFSQSTLASSFINSLKKIVLSQLTDRVIRPLIVLIGVLMLVYFNKSSEYIIYIYIGSVFIGYIIDLSFRKKYFTLDNVSQSNFSIKKNRDSLLFILIINFTTMIAVKTDTYMMGWMSGTEYSGVYNIYIKFANFISIGLTSISIAVIPFISEQIKLKQFKRARNSIKFASRLSILISSIAFTCIIIITPYFLSNYKSSLFESNINALFIICLAAFVNVVGGFSSSILLASNHLKQLLFCHVSSMIINIVLNIFLIPRYGIDGAAYATLISTIYVSILFYILSKKLVGINPTAFGK